MNTWKIKHVRNHSELYRNPDAWPKDLLSWLLRCCGEPHWGKSWDYIGGTIYFWNENLLTAFLLKWD